jgi:hypothetical protein
MKNIFKLSAICHLLSVICLSVHAQGTAFTYQGQLQNSGSPATGLYDFQFSLSNAPGGGSQIGVTVTNLAVGVTNGLFATTIDFGAVFAGEAAWLAISVRTNGTGSYAGLNPPQPLTPAPYAIFANTASNVSGTVPLAQLPNAVVTNNQSSLTVGNATVDDNLNLPATTTTSGIIYVGGSTLVHEFGTNNFFAGAGAGNLTLVGINDTGVGVSALHGLTSGNYNTAIGYFALASDTTGSQNTASGWGALLLNNNGIQNTAHGMQALRFNTAGSYNTAVGFDTLEQNTSGSNNTAVGFVALTANTTGIYNTACGFGALISNLIGRDNTAIGTVALYNNINGSNNVANGASALYSNTNGSYNTADGPYALFNNTSGSYNIALGAFAGTNITTGSYNIDIGNQGSNTDSSIVRIGDPNIQTATYLAGTVYANNVQLTSDRNAKENFQPVDYQAVLNRVAALPVTEWNYKTDREGVQHIGPMAQDFQAAFRLSADDKHISVVDEGGVALAAIQGLNQKLEETRAENAELKQRLEALEKIVLNQKLH